MNLEPFGLLHNIVLNFDLDIYFGSRHDAGMNRLFLKQVKIVSLEKIELNKPVDISMAFSKGIVTISLNHGQPIEEHTNFTVVTPYASVSSGTTEFDSRT